MTRTGFRWSTLGVGFSIWILGCQPPAPALVPSIAQRLVGEWRLAGQSGPTLSLTADGPNSGRFTMTVATLFPSVFRGRWTVHGRVFTMQIEDFPAMADWAIAWTGETPPSKYVQDVIRITETELVLRTQGQPVQDRYERVR